MNFRRWNVAATGAAVGAAVACALMPACTPSERPQWALAVHAGAGSLAGVPPDEVARIRAAVRQGLDAGVTVLSAGGRSIDAVQAAVHSMENSGVINAGRGAVLNHDGVAELDAAIMSGSDRAAGAVAAVRHIANPIDLARKVMDAHRHVLLVADGAEQFAREQGIELKPLDYFITERRKREWQKALEQEAGPPPTHGTCGAVALDRNGDLAAATSTGGLTNKHAGRVGDSPLIGAGTYAENGACAVSATGAGEYFIRYTAAADVCARVRYGREALGPAARDVIDRLKVAGGEGGLIALDGDGAIAMPYSSATMSRGWARSDRAPEVVVESK